MDQFFSLHTTWALIGDASRYRFAAWLTGDAHAQWAREKRIWLTRESVSVEESDSVPHTDEIYVYSPHMPPGIRLCILPDHEAAWGDHLKGFHFCLLCEGFPWKNDATVQILSGWELHQRRPPLAVLLMEAQHRVGAADLDRPAEVLREARRIYEARGIPVCVPQEGYVLGAFSLRESVIDRWRAELRAKLQVLRFEIEDFPMEYQELLGQYEESKGCLGMAVRDAVIYSYDTAWRSHERCLWAAWNHTAIMQLFASGQRLNLREALRQCENVLGATQLPQWAGLDAAATCEQFAAQLKKEFREYMHVPIIYDVPISWNEIPHKNAYKKMLDQRGEEPLVYWKRYEAFVRERVPDVLGEQLGRIAHALERMIA